MPHIPDATHDSHDLELVAAFAAGDLAGPSLDRALDIVDRCAHCARLADDLRLLAAAVHALPAPARPRDFRLTREDAAQARPGGLRGLLASLSGPRFAFATPLGTGIAALGIVGVLVASGSAPLIGGVTTPPEPMAMSLESPAASPVEERVAAMPPDAPSSAAPAATGDLEPMLFASSDPATDADPGGTSVPEIASEGGVGGPGEASGEPARGTDTAGKQADQQPLLAPAAALILAGMTLVAVRAAARRAA